eukprot:680430-Rhodomonas_salina.1
MRCVFDGQSVEATTISAKEMRCVSPRHESGVVSFEVADPTMQLSRSGTLFMFQERMEIVSITPTRATPSDGLLITVNGNGFSSNNYSCIFGSDQTVPATTISSSVLVCEVPKSLLGGVSVPVKITSNEVDYSRSSVYFLSEVLPEVFRMEPNRVHLNNAVITIHGANFRERDLFQYNFGAAIQLPLNFVSPVLATFVLPLMTDTGNYTIRVSNDGFAWSESSARLEIYRQTFFIQMHPSRGPVSGGTLITVSGLNRDLVDPAGIVYIGDDPTSRYDWSGDQAIVFSSVEVATPGRVLIKLKGSTPDRDLILGYFLYHLRATVIAIEPTVGVSAGGTVVRVQGRNFLDGSFCRFGLGEPTSATFQSPTLVLCDSPRREPGYSVVSISSTERDLSAESQGTDFLHVEPPTIRDMIPRVLVAGDSRVITVQGANFLDYVPWTCNVGVFTQMPAKRVDSQSLLCVVPVREPSNFTLQITFNDIDRLHPPYSFEVVPLFDVHAVSPVVGNVQGGDIIRLTSHAFTEFGALYCWFGSLKVDMDVHNATSATCISPPHPAGSVDLQVGTGDTTIVPGRWTFVYKHNYDFVSVTSILPTYGTMEGGEYITVVGRNFGPLWCHFGNSQKLHATVLSTTLAVCHTPKHVRGGEVAFEVSRESYTSTEERRFVFEVHPQILALEPTIISKSTDLHLSLKVENLRCKDVSICKIGIHLIEGACQGSNYLQCPLPRNLSHGNYTVSVSRDGVRSFSNEMHIEVLPTMHALAIHPASGPSDGGTHCTLTGIDIPSGHWVWCAFGTQLVPALTVTSTSL